MNAVNALRWLEISIFRFSCQSGPAHLHIVHIVKCETPHFAHCEM